MYLKLLAVVLIVMLTGCAQQPTKPLETTTPAKPAVKETPKAETPEKPAPEKQALKKQAPSENWQAEGRLAASHGGKGGNASFVWTQKGDSYQIKLFGPFGSGSVYITGHPTFVELREANGKTTRAQSPEMLLKKIAGWQVPLTGLRYWLRGVPSPKVKVSGQKEDNAGNLLSLVQQGWQVNYESYQEASALPSKLRLQNGDTKVKLIVTQWKAL